MTYLSLLFIKPVLNKVKCMRTRDWLRVAVFALLGLSPVFLQKLSKVAVTSVAIPDVYIPKVDMLANLMLILFAMLIFGLSQPSYAKLATLILPEYLILFKLLPGRYKILLFFSQLKKVCNTLLVSAALLYAYSAIAGAEIMHILHLLLLLSAIIIFVRTVLYVLPTVAAFVFNTGIERRALRILSLLLAALSLMLFGAEYEYSLIYLPNYVLASAFHVLLTADYERALFYALSLALYALAGVVVLYKLQFRNIEPSRIYEAAISANELEKKVSRAYTKFTKMFAFLGVNLQFIAAKETLQFFREYTNIVVMSCNAMILAAITILAQNNLPFSLERTMLFSATAYIGFYVGLTSLARDVKNLWLYKLTYPFWEKIALAKYFAAIFNTVAVCILLSPFFMLVAFLRGTDIADFYIRALHWSLPLLPFSSVATGLLFACVLPVKFKGAGETLIYNYGGMEPAFYFIVLFLAAGPFLALEAGGIFYVLFLGLLNVFMIFAAIHCLGQALSRNL